MAGNFINERFLLSNDTARELYFEYAEGLPIVDYHCHLSPAQIASDHRFEDMTDIWLKGDHYKWRAMRALGVTENFITGTASNEEKFMAWAKVVPQTLRNPLFHWTQMELKDPFGIDDFLNSDTAPAIYKKANAMLQTPEFSTRSLLLRNKVELVGTTDDPCDTLEHHIQLAGAGLSFAVRPSFRPDPVLNLQNKETFMQYLSLLEERSGIRIKTFNDLLAALQQRVDFFHANGCRVADHGLSWMPAVPADSSDLESSFEKFITNKSFSFPDPEAFSATVLLALCRMYHAKNWVQQFHLGAIRNVNTRLRKQLGADSGFDSIGDYSQAAGLAGFLDALDSTDQLARTILYNLNPAGNEVFASMTGNFNDGSMAGKIQFGSAWWFLDQKDGIEKQLDTLSNLGVLATFIGMTTDSRSFLSYSRHAYFRRVLCNILGREMEAGLVPNDKEWIGGIVQQVCYHNARNYFSA